MNMKAIRFMVQCMQNYMLFLSLQNSQVNRVRNVKVKLYHSNTFHLLLVLPRIPQKSFYSCSKPFARLSDSGKQISPGTNKSTQKLTGILFLVCVENCQYLQMQHLIQSFFTTLKALSEEKIEDIHNLKQQVFHSFLGDFSIDSN